MAVVVAPPPALVGDRLTAEGTIGFTVRVELTVLPPKEAEIVTGVAAPTADVVMENGAEVVDPAATRTLAGTPAAAGFELDNATAAPPLPAGPLRVTVFAAVELPPPALLGDSVMADTAVGLTVSVADWVTPLKVAEIVTGVAVDTGVVVMVKADETVAPWATVTDAGTEAIAGLELERETAAPPASAGALSVAVLAVVETPPAMLCGESVRPDTVMGLTERVAVALPPL